MQATDRPDSPQLEAGPIGAGCHSAIADSEGTDGDASPLSAPEACGCAPVRGAQPLARKLKIVLRLEPVEGGLRALVAVGADDCDPELRMLGAGDVASVLQLIPALLAAAETRWARQARYPMAARPPSQRSQPSAAQQTAPPPLGPNTTVPTPAVQSAAQSQLQLFG